MPDLTPETLAELRRLHIDLSPWLIGNPEDNAPCTRGELRTILDALSALLDAAAERDALAAKVERVRALPAKHPAGGWYVTSMRDVLAALDEEPQP